MNRVTTRPAAEQQKRLCLVLAEPFWIEKSFCD
jgi:hypothetical protein